MQSVSSEQAFLETYFLVLSQFGFDKAKELAVSQNVMCYMRCVNVSNRLTLVTWCCIVLHSVTIYDNV